LNEFIFSFFEFHFDGYFILIGQRYVKVFKVSKKNESLF